MNIFSDNFLFLKRYNLNLNLLVNLAVISESLVFLPIITRSQFGPIPLQESPYKMRCTAVFRHQSSWGSVAVKSLESCIIMLVVLVRHMFYMFDVTKLLLYCCKNDINKLFS